ncbi:hypothetical protein [Motilimonas sp. 1_MG-2023]|uniref:hypothetical protein n=1 Tax=Motilimonas TaxID=1914248 RepID=UPI0026E172C1|nr:hypothetical protein [Motilimonas sp. 1_MG-2023]MDO6527465.1 hypothetical protein [Motilimonas sp. 1_MG-2023]
MKKYYAPGAEPKPIDKAKMLILLALVPYCLWLAFAYRYHFIDGVNLAFHEAGHLFFMAFGDTLHLLGGTFLQLLVPALCGVHFYRLNQRFATALCGIWLAESMMYMAEYMGDANARVLPLVGGGRHDWYALFSSIGWLSKAEKIAGFSHFLAVILLLVCWIWAFKLVRRGEA